MKRTIKAILFVLAAVCLVGTVGCAVYACRAQQVLEEEIASADRDPETGIIRGSEPVTLEGDGSRACLLIHGWISSRIDFNDLGEQLNDRGFTVRLMLLPGHATSPRDLEQVSAEEMIESVRKEYRELRKSNDSVDLIGFSMGGALATLIAAEEPVDRLVLVAPFYEISYRWFYILPVETWNALFSPFVSYIVKSETHKQVNRVEARPHIFSYRAVPTSSVDLLCDLGRRAGRPDVLERIDCPVLLVYSPGDRAASPDAALDALGLMGSAEKRDVSCPRSNHHILWDYDGPQAVEAVCAFLGK